MTLSDLSIERPVLSTVMSLLIVVTGISAFRTLPVRELPDVDKPVISISTIYMGASPETVEATITEPIEAEMNGLEGIETITSTSYYGRSIINVEFEAGRDLDLAATDVSSAVQRAVGDLPEEAQRPVTRKSGATSDPIIWINVYGDDYGPADLTDIADRLVQSRMQLLQGVTQAIIGGERRYAMRIWLDPARMAAHSIDALDIRDALRASNLQLPAGEIEATTRKFTINANAQLEGAKDFGAIVIRETDDMPIRLRDLGWVELGSENYHTITRYSGRPVVGVGIVRQSRANELEIADAVRAEMAAIAPSLPPGVELGIATDSTIFVREAMKEVWKTLAIAFCVVVLVNLFFLQSRTTTMIVSIVIPVSVVGTFAAMSTLGFSINILTLLALVLCIGLLVDDAIVVLENVYRHQERGEGRLEAARVGAREVVFPVLATSAAVIAVLVPLSMMTGDTGRLFREFAVTAAAAVAISTFVALSLVPMLCSQFLVVKDRSSTVSRIINRGVSGLLAFYDATLDLALRSRLLVMLMIGIFIAAAALIYNALPTTFLPLEDRGEAMVVIRAPEGSTAAYTARALDQVQEALLATPEIEGFFQAIGMGFGRGDDTGLGIVFIRFKHWDDRTRKQQDVVAELFPRFLGGIREALVFIINRPSLGQSSDADVEIVLTSSSATLEEFGELMSRITGRARSNGFLVNVDSDLRLANPQLEIDFDRERAADLGVPVRSIAESLRLLVSQGAADEFVLRNQQYDVVMAVESPMRSIPEQLGEIHVRARDDAMIPLSALIAPRAEIGPSTLNHYGLRRSATLSANLAPGANLEAALSSLEQIFSDELPAGFTRELRGTAREFRESSQQIFITFALAIVIIYLVLAAQFESFVHPLTVLFSVPLATLGAVGALWTVNEIGPPQSLNLYSQIGMVLLIGLVTKNAILLVDFANREYAKGVELFDALRAAGHTRFRPILMTSSTSILGGLPLVIASGAGAESRQAIGIAVVGGLLFSTVFTLIVVPVVHSGLVRASERLTRRRGLESTVETTTHP
ncbi:MAG: efflux RND transporter permease subunit [Myxococcales bacterium]|nr:efflux RND transporter permease subunit [Myxococcales bacterium]HIK84683.1 efflux RND transporter permease subunit [Myxococcales bacterium]